MKYFIYFVKNILNGKIYVGKTNNTHRRWTCHRNHPFSNSEKRRTECPKLYAAIRKYGAANFSFEIVAEYNSYEDCCQAEVEFIKKENSIGNGYNISEGGDGVSPGIHHPFYGKKHTQESRKKISQSKIGKKIGPASQERKDKISSALLGKKKSTIKGQNNPASKLKTADIPVIRKLISEGNTIASVSRMFGVSFPTIKYIVQGKTWKHVI